MSANHHDLQPGETRRVLHSTPQRGESLEHVPLLQREDGQLDRSTEGRERAKAPHAIRLHVGYNLYRAEHGNSQFELSLGTDLSDDELRAVLAKLRDQRDEENATAQAAHEADRVALDTAKPEVLRALAEAMNTVERTEAALTSFGFEENAVDFRRFAQFLSERTSVVRNVRLTKSAHEGARQSLTVAIDALDREHRKREHAKAERRRLMVEMLAEAGIQLS